jgi:hypothetical protein
MRSLLILFLFLSILSACSAAPRRCETLTIAAWHSPDGYRVDGRCSNGGESEIFPIAISDSPIALPSDATPSAESAGDSKAAPAAVTASES